MSRLLHIFSRRGEEAGAILVTFALFAPVALLFVAFVIDTGNSWLHKRHLQVQADAAALAASLNFQPCDNSAITGTAQQYGGVAGNPLYNQQVGGTPGSNIHQLINSQTFYNQSTPVDSTVNTASPCQAMMVDVKMTETDLPWYMQVFPGLSSMFGGSSQTFNGVPYINAQARVELRQMTTSTGDIPIAVNDVVFKSAEAFFLDESNSSNVTVLGSARLTPQGLSNGLSMWSSAASPFSLTVPTSSGSDVGIRIAVSDSANNLTGNMTNDCSASGVLCFDKSSSNAQLLDVHGYSTSGTGTLAAPLMRQVLMTPGTCGDQYYTSSASNCTQGIQAYIDFGANPNLSGVQVKANGSVLTCTSAQPAVCTGTVSVTAASGRTPVTITVKQGNSTLTFSNVQSTYAAAVNGNAGPIQALGLYESGVSDVSALQQGTIHSLVVQMGVTPSLSTAQSVNDPVVTMRLDGTGSQNQSVSCTPVSTPANISDPFAAAIATGCAGTYQINQPLVCPDPTDTNNNPIDCLPPNTGNATNQPAKGLNYRILGSTQPTSCTSPNHWSSFPNISESDPRIVTVFVTPYGSFGGNGGSSSQNQPNMDFAAFYITGWNASGGGFNNPCQGQGDDPAQAGTMVGHFITYINTLNTGSNGGTACVANSLNECVAVLTR